LRPFWQNADTFRSFPLPSGEKLAPYRFIKHLGAEFRCRECHRKGAEVDVRGVLGYYG
jgi:hypothetical protein